jgi:glycosyltransferase involved in cell wall biosynthesis
MTEISVVIPTRDRRRRLGLALRSVLDQRDVDVEVIVVDDGSTDATADVVAGLREPRVRVIVREHPGGVSVARNHGATEASGEWLGFLDDDDVWSPDKLARQISAARAADRAWAYTGWVVIDDELQVTAGRPPLPPDRVAKALYRRNAIPTGGSNVVVHRKAFERVGGFDPQLTNGEDWELWIRLTGEGLPAWVPEPLVAYLIHSGNASLDIGAMWSTVDIIEQRHRTRVDRGSIEQWIAESSLRTGRRGEALKHLALAAMHGRAPAVAADLLDALRRLVDRGLRRAPRTPPRVKDAAWAARAQSWLDELSTPPATSLL